jgi:exodeoxyribonuclease-3
VRIATWNVNGLRARLDFLCLWLQSRKPDVVGLQELKMQDDQLPHEALAAVGYRAFSHGQKSWNGVAILARDPDAGGPSVEVLRRGLPGQEDFGARLMTAQITSDADSLRFTTAYCPNGKHLEHADYARKLAWFDTLAEHVAETESPDEPMVLCGDINICREPLDSWNEENMAGAIFHTDAERERLARLIDWGLVDVFRDRHPDTQAFSWWDYRGGAFHRKQGLRIDLLLATRRVAERVSSIEIDREFRKKQEGLTASDHAPVWMDLD